MHHTSVTFRVDNVSPATEPLKECEIREAVQSIFGGEIEVCSGCHGAMIMNISLLGSRPRSSSHIMPLTKHEPGGEHQRVCPIAFTIMSDGKKGIIAALKATWPEAPHQRCQTHFLNNLADSVMVHDAELRKGLRDAVGYVASPPETLGEEGGEATSPF